MKSARDQARQRLLDAAQAQAPATSLPNPTELREAAREDAAIRVSSLLQTFAMPSMDEAMIETLLLDTIANATVAGFARGWDAGIEASAEAIGKLERFRR